jgi:hypothetical protein
VGGVTGITGATTGGGVPVGGGEGSGGTVTHPAATKSIDAAKTIRARCGRRSPKAMEWFLLEAMVALLLAIGIVWWTMGPKRRKPPRKNTNDAGNERTR